MTTLRNDIFNIFLSNHNLAYSAVELSRMTQEKSSKIRYHLTSLLNDGEIEYGWVSQGRSYYVLTEKHIPQPIDRRGTQRSPFGIGS